VLEAEEGAVLVASFYDAVGEEGELGSGASWKAKPGSACAESIWRIRHS
jgi:hypothetical protein